MKKLTLLVISLVVTTLSYSQDFNRIIRATKSEWRNEAWVTVAADNPVSLFVIIKDWDITIGTYKFRTFDAPEKNVYETHITYTWKCVNGNGDKCLFMMKKFRPEISQHVMYSIVYTSGVMYEYESE